MTLKEKLCNLRDKLVDGRIFNRDYEFDAELDDHIVPDTGLYKLSFVDYHRYGENYGIYSNNVSLLYWSGDVFTLPSNMDKNDAFKVLSYLTDFIEKEDDIEIGSLKSVRTLDAALNLERFGFRKVNCNDKTAAVELFTVAGRSLLFKKSSYYKRYFNWYTEGVTLEEVEQIYAKAGMEFRDIVWLKDKVKEK